MALKQTEFDELDEFLSGDLVGDEAMDIISAHGFITALAVSPVLLGSEEWLPTVLDRESSALDSDDFRPACELLLKMRKSIDSALYHSTDLGIPCPLEVETDREMWCLRIWCLGFMEGHFRNEKAWFDRNEETVAGLIFPIAAISGLFDEDDDFKQLGRNVKLLENLCEQVPEVATDLYLYFHAPQEHPVPKPTTAKPTKKGRK